VNADIMRKEMMKCIQTLAKYSFEVCIGDGGRIKGA